MASWCRLKSPRCRGAWWMCPRTVDQRVCTQRPPVQATTRGLSGAVLTVEPVFVTGESSEDEACARMLHGGRLNSLRTRSQAFQCFIAARGLRSSGAG